MPDHLGIEEAIKRLRRVQTLYAQLRAEADESGLLDLTTRADFNEICSTFGPALEGARVNLRQIFSGAFHAKSGTLILANKPMQLLCQAPRSQTHYLLRHIACTLYRPGLGIELVNIGLVGDVTRGRVILRSESACAPSFLFRSERCNCCYQWQSALEMAAQLNAVHPPTDLKGAAFEKWVVEQPRGDGPGVVLLHIDSQSGMGSGFTSGEFVIDLTSRALQRQLGEMRVEQEMSVGLKEGYESLGIQPDARRAHDEAGYQLPYILLDWLGISQDLACMSNNPLKLKHLQENGYRVHRVKSLGHIGALGLHEAGQRNRDFGHADIGAETVSFAEELERLKEELGKLATT